MMPSILSKAIVTPIYLLHTIWWKVGNLLGRNAKQEVRVRNTTGAFTFIATK